MATASQSGTETPREPRATILRRLDALDARVARLERGLGYAPDVSESRDGHARAASAIGTSAATTSEWLPMVGRTLLILGGAFVLRAVTEGEMVPPTVGVTLGIVYALAWLVAADRAARGGRPASATWWGVATVLIALPLLWEATLTFRFLEPSLAAGAVTSVGALAMGVAWRHRLRGLAWIVVSFTIATLLGMAVATRMPGTITLCLLAIGLATLWLGYLRGIHGPARLAAAAASGSVAMLGLTVVVAHESRRADLVDVRAVIWLQLALIAVYVGSAIGRVLVRRRALRVGELVTGSTSAAVGLGGALLVAHATGTGRIGLGLVAGLLGLAGYWATFTLSGLSEQRANMLFFSSLALVCVIVSLGMLLPSAWLVSALAAGAVAMAWAGAVRTRATLSVHGAIYGVTAVAASGLLALGFSAFGVSSSAPAHPVGAPMLVALAGTLGYCGFAVAARERTWGPLARFPKLVVIAATAIGTAGIAVAAAEPWLPRADGTAAPDARALAALRTLVLAVLAVGLARVASVPRLHQAAWLVYPVLIAGGLKLVLEDVRVGGPATLVLSFVIFGGALILAPRLLRAAHPAPTLPLRTPPGSQ